MTKRQGDLVGSAKDGGTGKKELFSFGLVLKTALIIIAAALVLAMLKSPEELAAKHGKSQTSPAEIDSRQATTTLPSGP